MLQKSLLTVLLCTLVLTGCGFALRQSPNTSHTATAIISDGTDGNALKAHLSQTLNLRGIDGRTADTIRLHNVRFRRYELVGILTEVRLVLMADVQYDLGKQMHTYPLQVEHSYQHNEAGVASDSQGERAKDWLYHALAEQIAEQYRILSQN